MKKNYAESPEQRFEIVKEALRAYRTETAYLKGREALLMELLNSWLEWYYKQPGKPATVCNDLVIKSHAALLHAPEGRRVK